MSAAAGWVLPLLLWAAVTLGARGMLARFGLIRCRIGDWGTAFLCGFTCQTSLVYFGALAGLPPRAPLMLGAAGVILVAGLLLRRRTPPVERRPEPWTPAEIVVAGALTAYAGFVIVNALFFPVSAMDAHSYAGRARFMLLDGTLNIALYHWPASGITGATNITYPPLFSLALGTVPALGGWQPKLVTALFSLAWPLCLYGFLRERLPRLAALGWTLFLAMTPEVFAHSEFALLNLPAMALILLEAVSLARYLQAGRRRWLGLAAVAAAGAAGVRSDAVLIHAVLWVCAAFFALRDRPGQAGLVATVRPMILVLAAPLLTWGTWALYLKLVVGLSTAGPLSVTGNLGLGLMLREAPLRIFDFHANGPLFYLWAASIPLLFLGRGHGGASGAMRREGLFFQAATLGILLALVLLFSMLPLGFGHADPRDLMFSSFKRALFYAVPLAGLAVALSAPGRRLAEWGKGWLHRGTLHRFPPESN